jgi:hypothetical protein
MSPTGETCLTVRERERERRGELGRWAAWGGSEKKTARWLGLAGGKEGEWVGQAGLGHTEKRKEEEEDGPGQEEKERENEMHSNTFEFEFKI